MQVQDESTLCWATWRSGALTDTELEKLLELAQGFNEQTAKGAFRLLQWLGTVRLTTDDDACSYVNVAAQRRACCSRNGQ